MVFGECPSPDGWCSGALAHQDLTTCTGIVIGSEVAAREFQVAPDFESGGGDGIGTHTHVSCVSVEVQYVPLGGVGGGVVDPQFGVVGAVYVEEPPGVVVPEFGDVDVGRRSNLCDEGEGSGVDVQSCLGCCQSDSDGATLCNTHPFGVVGFEDEWLVVGGAQELRGVDGVTGEVPGVGIGFYGG